MNDLIKSYLHRKRASEDIEVESQSHDDKDDEHVVLPEEPTNETPSVTERPEDENNSKAKSASNAQTLSTFVADYEKLTSSHVHIGQLRPQCSLTRNCVTCSCFHLKEERAALN